jgi:hypothetical protein
MQDDAETKRIAEKCWDNHHNNFREHFKASISFAIEVIKSLFVMNGAGLTAVIAYVGFSQRFTASGPSRIGLEIGIFATALALTALTCMFAYLSQYSHTCAHYSVIFNLKHPYIHPNAKQKLWKRLGGFFQIVAMLTAIFSFCMFCYGSFLVFNRFLQ